MASDVLATCTEVPANEKGQEEAVVDCVAFFTKRENVVRILGEKNKFQRNVFGEYINYRMKICIF